MARSKYIDKICIFAVMVAVLIAGIFGNQRLSEKANRKLGYEDLLFNTSKVHTIDIQIENWDEFIKNADAKKYHNCNVTIDGETFKNIAIRTKGGSSLEDVSAAKGTRYSLKLEFDKNNKGVTYHGLDKLNLNNMIYDKTYMKDHLTYQMMAKMGVTTPLTSYSFIRINGADFGLYLNIEGIEESFLQRNYGTTSGALYKPEGVGESKDDEQEKTQKQTKEENTSQDTSVDWENIDWNSLSEEEMKKYEELFGGDGNDEASDAVCLKYIDDQLSSYTDIFDMAKIKVTKAKKKRLIQSLQILNSGKNIGSVVDTQAVIKYFVVQNFISNDDGYTSANVHNYYLYEKNGKMSMIPWDYNLAFGTMGEHNESEVINQSMDTLLTGEDVSTRPMFAWIVNDNKYKELYHTYYQQFIASMIDNGEVDNLIDETAILLQPYIEKDPTKFYSADTFSTGIASLKKYCELRAAKIKDELSGGNAVVDTTGFSYNDMGAQDEGMSENEEKGEAYDTEVTAN